MSTTPGASPAPQKSARTHPVHMPMLIAAAIAAILMVSPATAAVGGVSGSSRPARPSHTSTGSADRSSRPNRADWEKIKTAARLCTMALAPHRTARFRAFAANLGLTELISIHPLARGPCATAVIYLYNNLLDLDNAYPGENWTPLRRAVAKEPSIDACAPRPSRQHDA
jgi:hypothetical protein